MRVHGVEGAAMGDQVAPGPIDAEPERARHPRRSRRSAADVLVEALERAPLDIPAVAPWLPPLAAEGWLLASLNALQESFFVAEAERDELGDVVELRFRFLNTAAQKLYGHSPDDILGRGLRELFPSVDDLGIFACYVEPLHTGRPSAMRVPTFDENGVRGAFDVEARPYPFGDGVVVTAVDVTEEVRAQLELQDS